METLVKYADVAHASVHAVEKHDDRCAGEDWELDSFEGLRFLMARAEKRFARRRHVLSQYG